tara:strand:+ start:223 stop:498 length:276 start_codon:yes stop_codon:yes gene_type:complete
MPELKFNIGKKDYTLHCEEGEENELKKAVEIVNEKMNLFIDETEITLTRKFLMTSILIASELSQKNEKEFDKSMQNELDNLFLRIERILDL